jgi:hypothetical protein
MSKNINHKGKHITHYSNKAKTFQELYSRKIFIINLSIRNLMVDLTDSSGRGREGSPTDHS